MFYQCMSNLWHVWFSLFRPVRVGNPLVMLLFVGCVCCVISPVAFFGAASAGLRALATFLCRYNQIIQIRL
jgi:hypothetical protein